MQVKIIKKFHKIHKVHHTDSNGTVWANKRRGVYFKPEAEDWQYFSKFPKTSIFDSLAFSKILSRMFRLGNCNIYTNQKGEVLGIRRGVVYRLQKNQEAIPLFEIRGHCALHASFAEDAQGWTYFGEYANNAARQAVRLWRVSPDLDQWEIAHEFKPGEIRHIHGVYIDTFEPAKIWLATGDFKDECYLFCSHDRFETLERFGDGSQNWRAVKLFFTKTHIAWITDSDLHQNYACRMARKSGEIEVGQEIDSTGWYGARTKEGIYITFTTVESGPGIKSNKSKILISQDAFNWASLYDFKKDFWKPYKIFKYGVIFCTSGPVSLGQLYLSGEALIGFDQKTLLISIQDNQQHEMPA